MHHTGEDQLMIPLLSDLGVEFFRECAVTEITPGSIVGQPRMPGASPLRWDADAIVLVDAA